MKLDWSVQKMTVSNTPTEYDFESWVQQTLSMAVPDGKAAELTVRLVDNEERRNAPP